MRSWCAERDVPLHVFAFTDVAGKAGLARDAAYLVRPDGHVGLASPGGDPTAFDTYAARWLPAGRPVVRRG